MYREARIKSDIEVPDFPVGVFHVQAGERVAVIEYRGNRALIMIESNGDLAAWVNERELEYQSFEDRTISWSIGARDEHQFLPSYG